MSDLRREPPQDVEALIRAAGNFVRASDDLRPRVLESARIECAERRFATCLRGFLLAAAIVILVLLQCWSAPSQPGPVSPAARLQHQDNPGWDTVDAFRDLRRRLALLWRSTL